MGDTHIVDAVVRAIDGERLWRRHQEIARFGASGRGGVNRQALTREDADAHRLVLEWAYARGFSASIDSIGNIFIRRAGTDASAPPIIAGSHLDT
ncbi:MAG: Zn-dependent hydrolase, partial [Candidatus Binataceae bacterium]